MSASGFLIEGSSCDEPYSAFLLSVESVAVEIERATIAIADRYKNIQANECTHPQYHTPG